MSATTERVLEALDVPAEYRERKIARDPVRWSEALGERIAELLGQGVSLYRACQRPGMPSEAAVRQWALDPEHPFCEMHEKAKLISYHRMAEDLLEIVDDGRNDWMASEDPDNPGYKLNGEHVQRSKLRADKRQWLLTKCLPRIYGDKLELNHTGEVNHRVTVRKAKAFDALDYEDLQQLEALMVKAEERGKSLQIEGKVVDQPEDGAVDIRLT